MIYLMISLEALKNWKGGVAYVPVFLPVQIQGTPSPSNPDVAPKLDDDLGELDDILNELNNESDEIEARMRSAQNQNHEFDFVQLLQGSLHSMDAVDLAQDVDIRKNLSVRPYNMLCTSAQVKLEHRLLQEAKTNLEMLQILHSAPDYRSLLRKEIDRLFDEWEEHCINSKKVSIE